MLGAQMRRHLAGRLCFVVRRIGKANGERLGSVLRDLLTASRPTTIDESTPPERNTPSGTSLTQSQPHGSLEQLAQLVDVFGLGPSILRAIEIGLPIGLHLQPIVLEHCHMPRRQLARCRERSSAGAGTY